MRLWSSTFAVTLVGGLFATGCTSLRDGASDSQGVERFHLQLIDSFNTCNADTFVSAYAELFTFTTSHTAEAIEESDGLRGYLAYGCEQSPSPQVRLSSEHVRFFSDHAMVTGQYVFRRLIEGKLGEETQNYTLVLLRANGGWRISAHHVSLAP